MAPSGVLAVCGGHGGKACANEGRGDKHADAECRFANPTALNAASGWLFVNDPENVQYLCATNVRNYGRRYLPDIYKWVTHEKGILGSQVRSHG